MADHTPQVFHGVSRSQFGRLTEQARAAGIEMNGNRGRASKMGVEVEWNYSEEREELVLTCLETPFFVSVNQVDEKLRSLVNAAIAS